MKNYQKLDGTLWAFEEDGSQDYLITEDMNLLSAEELEAIQNPPPSKEDRITALQAAYENDLEKLNKAWLVALIADGVNEANRQAVIKQQMTALDEQLEIDIFAIIMEE